MRLDRDGYIYAAPYLQWLGRSWKIGKEGRGSVRVPIAFARPVSNR